VKRLGRSVCVFDRSSARLWILPVVSLTLGLSPLDDHGVGPELSGRHLHLVVIVTVTCKPTAKGRHKADLFERPRRPFEKDDHMFGFYRGVLLIAIAILEPQVVQAESEIPEHIFQIISTVLTSASFMLVCPL